MKGARLILLLVLVTGSCLATVALAQADQALPPLTRPGAPAPTPPDTVQATVDLPREWPDPVAVQVLPDTLFIGLPAELRLVFAEGRIAEFVPGPGDAAALADSLQDLNFAEEWVHWDRERLPARVAGDTLVVPMTIFQIKPFRVEAGSSRSAVMTVALRTEGLDEVVSVRDPRRWGWNTLLILLVALGLALLVVLILWAWTARKVATETLVQWHPPRPAWIGAALDLVTLLDRGLVQRGDARAFLDGLAGICRRYLAGRFGIGAAEMTAGEIAHACRGRGFASSRTSPFLGLLEELDALRYDPSPLGRATCLRAARSFLEGMTEVRLLPRYTPVPAGELLAAEKAWARLQEELVQTALPRDEEEFAPPGAVEGRP